MKSGIVVMRPTGAEFIEMPIYVGYLGLPCTHCGLTNTTYEVYPRSVETNCLLCARPQKDEQGRFIRLPDHIMDYIEEKVR